MSQYTIVEPAGYADLMNQYAVNPLTARILSGSEFTPFQIQSFLHPDPPQDPFLQDELVKIHERLLQARERKEKVFIGGDYDTDGICATAIMVRLCHALGIPCGFYIPNRFEEGYGLSLERTKQAVNKGYRLFITVDNGVSAFEPLAYLAQEKIDVIVLDHHEISAPVSCYALFHPDTAGGTYQWLCGGGCAYQVVRTFPEIDDGPYLTLAMCASIGDMMELYGCNRWIVKKGLSAMNHNALPALRYLLARPQEVADEQDVAFQIVPKLNSFGRLADQANANDAVRYLVEEDMRKVKAFSTQLWQINDERKKLTANMLEAIRPDEIQGDFILVDHADFHPGILGLAANKLLSDSGKPVLLATDTSKGVLGSIRCPQGMDIMPFLRDHQDCFVSYGGHAQAAGITIKPERKEEFYQQVRSLHPRIHPSVKKAVRIPVEELTVANIDEWFSYKPFGKGFPIAPIAVTGVPYSSYRTMGKDEYRRWDIGDKLCAVTFKGDKIETRGCGNTAMIGQLQCNYFRGKAQAQLHLVEIQRP